MSLESEIYTTSIIRDGKKYTQVHRKTKKEVKSVDLVINERRKWEPFGINNGEYATELAPVHWILPKLKKELDETPITKSVIICSKCKKPGHFSINCKEVVIASNNTIENTLFYKGVICFKCKQEGHFSKDCKKVAQNESITLKVSNLPDDITTRELEDIFTKYGDLKREGHRRCINMAKKYGTDVFSGTAYITFAESQEGLQAMKMLKNTRIGICIIDIEIAEQRE